MEHLNDRTVRFESAEELKRFEEFLAAEESGYVKAGEALRILGCSRATLCHYVRRGLVKAKKNEGGQYLYELDSVLASRKRPLEA